MLTNDDLAYTMALVFDGYELNGSRAAAIQYAAVNLDFLTYDAVRYRIEQARERVGLEPPWR